MPVDGWYQIAPDGEFPHAAAGLNQVVEWAVCDAMVTGGRRKTVDTSIFARELSLPLEFQGHLNLAVVAVVMLDEGFDEHADDV